MLKGAHAWSELFLFPQTQGHSASAMAKAATSSQPRLTILGAVISTKQPFALHAQTPRCSGLALPPSNPLPFRPLSTWQLQESDRPCIGTFFIVVIIIARPRTCIVFQKLDAHLGSLWTDSIYDSRATVSTNWVESTADGPEKLCPVRGEASVDGPRMTSKRWL